MDRINKKLKKRIMRRIYFAFFLRKATSVFAIEVYAFVFFAGVLLSSVSLKNIFANMPKLTDISALYTFYVSAFLNTELMVQFLLTGVFAAAFILFKDIIKSHNTPYRIAV